MSVVSQKAEPNDVLFTVADLSTVWVTANIPESDVASVPRIQGGAIRLTSAAYGSRIFPAQLLSVGAMVDPQTRTVPLLAQTDNHDGLLKPGMFVRILLDSPATEKALTVPHSCRRRDRGQERRLRSRQAARRRGAGPPRVLLPAPRDGPRGRRPRRRQVGLEGG